MIRVHVAGASGYAAAEAIALLCRHPEFELGALESVSHAGEEVRVHFPQLRTFARRFDREGSVLASVRAGDAVILAGAHGTAATLAPKVLAKGARAIDLSGDFRLTPTRAVYGFAERYAPQIASAQFVANPGCYPTATLLATLPLAPLAPKRIIVDAKSGITGAGRTPAIAALFAEVNGDIRAYGLCGHRHEAEIVEQWAFAGIGASLTFTPHVVPIARGMLVDAYCIFDRPVDETVVRGAFAQTYGSNPFVRILESGCAPSVPAVAGSNDAEIAISVLGDVVRVICAIDNLGRGAAGQAIRNLNLMYEFPEVSGFHAYAYA